MNTKVLSINGKNFKQYKNTKYYSSICGEIYSSISNKILKPSRRGRGAKKYLYIDINFGNGQKHCSIHRIVYETWIGDIPNDKIVLHKDDDETNNSVDNLFLGTQKENIADCFKNKNRVGNLWILTILDKEKGETLCFCPASDFIGYCGHQNKNGSLSKFFNKNWFKKRYCIVDYKRCLSKYEIGSFEILSIIISRMSRVYLAETTPRMKACA